ncbi:MAG TPA: hypothetical protein VE974_01855 [Thermoanaerobaculia bacterium]|nr:hypothetical protein [Thermoanaerobaculia bacterium]
MDQQNPNDPNSGLNPGSSGETGSGGMSSTPGFGSGGTGTGMSSGGGMTTGSGGISSGGAPIGVVSGSDADTFGSPSSSPDIASPGTSPDAEEQYCTHCGHALTESKGLEQFLGRLGISGDMFSNLKGQFQNVDIDEYLNTAREYLKGSSTKVTNYTKENPAKVAAGVAALALGAGLIYAAVNRDKSDTTVAATGIEIQPDPNAGLNRGGDFDRDRGGNPGYDPNRT